MLFAWQKTVADLRGSTISTPLSANQGKWSDFGGYLTHGSSCVKVNDFGGSVSPEVQRSWNTVKTDLEDEEFEGFSFIHIYSSVGFCDIKVHVH